MKKEEEDIKCHYKKTHDKNKNEWEKREQEEYHWETFKNTLGHQKQVTLYIQKEDDENNKRAK